MPGRSTNPINPPTRVNARNPQRCDKPETPTAATETGQLLPLRSRGGWCQARPCPTLDARVPARASASLRPRPAPLAPAVSRTTPPARKDRLRDGPHLPKWRLAVTVAIWCACARPRTRSFVPARARPPSGPPCDAHFPNSFPFVTVTDCLCCRSIRTSPPRSPERPDVKEESTA